MIKAFIVKERRGQVDGVSKWKHKYNNFHGKNFYRYFFTVNSKNSRRKTKNYCCCCLKIFDRQYLSSSEESLNVLQAVIFFVIFTKPKVLLPLLTGDNVPGIFKFISYEKRQLDRIY